MLSPLTPFQFVIDVAVESHFYGPSCSVKLHSAHIRRRRYLHYLSYPNDRYGGLGSFGKHGRFFGLYPRQGVQAIASHETVAQTPPDLLVEWKQCGDARK